MRKRSKSEIYGSAKTRGDKAVTDQGTGGPIFQTVSATSSIHEFCLLF